MPDVAIETDHPTNVTQASDVLAEVFRTGAVGDVFTEDVFLDGHPPFWRFQIQGRDAFAEWLRGYVGEHVTVDVVRTVATSDGFVTEHVDEHVEGGARMTSRKLVLCTMRETRIAELSVYCSGDWDAELRARHQAEAPIFRP